MIYGYGRSSTNALWALIGANVAVFIATLISPAAIVMLGLMPAALPEAPWTMVTNLFVHGGFGHILGNMFTLYFFGSYLCLLLGERTFLIVYFVGGIVGNIFYIALAFLMGSPFAIAIGASGAIFALGGVLAAMRPQLRVLVFPIPAPIPLWIAVIGGFVVVSFFPGVAWQAHLGGLAFGLVAGYFFRRRELGRSIL